ncbi:MAG: peptidylprolyl isomerase [Paracoccaceae bacterium]|jgi:peptidyl-prolyl cis-trans isomerase SurA
MGKTLNWTLAVTLVFCAWVSTAYAANPYSAAYSVNDSIITHFDISERAKLLRGLGIQSPNIQQEATDQLIEDRLKLRAASIIGLSLDSAALARGLANLAANQNTTAQALWAKARARGVSRQAYEDFFEVQLLWRDLVQRRFRQAANPTSVDLDNAVNIAAAVTQTTILLAEIALPFAERGEEATIAFADRLARDLNSGANFKDAVTRFSRSQTAANGGQIGWLAPERLPSAIAAKVIGLGSGQVSDPIRISTGIIILKVVASKTVSSALQKTVSVEYTILDFAGQTNAVARATAMQSGLDECSTGTSSAANFGPLSGMFGPTSVDSVPADISVSLARLMAGKSEIITNGDSVLLIQLCNRTTDLAQEVQTQITNGLFGQKLTKLAEGYLLELRRTAIIEKR